MKFPDQSVIQRQPTLSQQLTIYLTNLIRNGDFSPGENFPSETELARSLDVSRPVVREALSGMKHNGLLESRKGGRTQVAMDTSGFVFRIEAEAHKDKRFLAYLYEIRAIIEPEATALAARRATPKAIKRIRGKLASLKKAIAEGKEGTKESLEFHKSVIDASGNPHLAKFINWVGKKLWSFIHSNNLEHNGKMIANVHQEHEAIVEAIENQDPQEARKIGRRHVLQAAKRHGIEIMLPE